MASKRVKQRSKARAKARSKREEARLPEQKQAVTETDNRTEEEKRRIFEIAQLYVQLGSRSLQQVAEYNKGNTVGNEPLWVEDFNYNPLALMLYRSRRLRGLEPDGQKGQNDGAR